MKMAVLLQYSRRIFFLYLVIHVSKGQECLEVENRNGYFGSYMKQKEITRHQQAIISSYKLTCNGMCGNITEWGVDLQPGGDMHQMNYTLDLQVWRPSPTVDDSTGTGCYSLVGNNRFTSISLSGGVAVVTPSPQDYIKFQPGDVLGFYVEEDRRDKPGGVVILTSRSFTSELVWHASIAPTMATSQNGDCPYSVGSTGGVLNTLTQAAPVISISITTFPCPLPPSMATTQPTPPPPNPTTDSEGMPPTTNRQTQEPVDPLTTNGETTSDSTVTNDTADSSLPIGLALGLIFLTALIAITIVISAVVFWKVRKIARLTFSMQRNRAYHGVTVQSVATASLEISYIYPMVDNDESEQNNSVIITEQNKAYEPRCSENLELNYTEIDTERSAAARARDSETDNQRRSEPTPTSNEDWRQASLESNRVYGRASMPQGIDTYEPMTPWSGTVEKYDLDYM